MIVLVRTTWQQNPNPDPNDEDYQVLMKYHFYISNGKSHDDYFVQDCLLLHWQFMCWILAFNLFSIGCGQMGVLFNLIVESHGILLIDTHIWHVDVQCFGVFGIGHGKGPHDGVGAVLNKIIRNR